MRWRPRDEDVGAVSDAPMSTVLINVEELAALRRAMHLGSRFVVDARDATADARSGSVSAGRMPIELVTVLDGAPMDSLFRQPRYEPLDDAGASVRAGSEAASSASASADEAASPTAASTAVVVRDASSASLAISSGPQGAARGKQLQAARYFNMDVTYTEPELAHLMAALEAVTIKDRVTYFARLGGHRRRDVAGGESTALAVALTEDGERRFLRLRAAAARIVADVAPPADPQIPTLARQYREWASNGRKGKFQIVLFPDARAAYPQANVVQLEGPLKVEGRDYKPSLVESRTDIISTDASTVYSSYLAPATTLARLHWHENAQSGVLKAGPTIIQTTDYNKLYWPKFLTDAAASATPGTQGGAATVTNPVFSRAELDSWRIDGFFAVSNEMLRSSIMNFEAVLAEAAARAIATQVATYLAAGTGSSQPQGLGGADTTTTAGKTAADDTSFTVDELIELKLSVLPQARMNGTWLFGTSAYLALNLKKDGEGQYLLRPSANAGEPEMLLGNPIYEEAGYPAVTTGLIPVTFGDVSQFIVREVGPVVFEASEEFAWSSFETTFRFAKWMDSELLDTAACKHLVMA
jgi:HK97 family phage major capsid protein